MGKIWTWRILRELAFTFIKIHLKANIIETKWHQLKKNKQINRINKIFQKDIKINMEISYMIMMGFQVGGRKELFNKWFGEK